MPYTAKSEKTARIKMRSLTGQPTGAPIKHWARPDIRELQTRHYAIELGEGQEWRELKSVYILWDYEAGVALRQWKKEWIKRIILMDGTVIEC